MGFYFGILSFYFGILGFYFWNVSYLGFLGFYFGILGFYFGILGFYFWNVSYLGFFLFWIVSYLGFFLFWIVSCLGGFLIGDRLMVGRRAGHLRRAFARFAYWRLVCPVVPVEPRSALPLPLWVRLKGFFAPLRQAGLIPARRETSEGQSRGDS